MNLVYLISNKIKLDIVSVENMNLVSLSTLSIFIEDEIKNNCWSNIVTLCTVMKDWAISTKIFLDLYLSATALSANAHIQLFSQHSLQIRDLTYREVNEAKLKFKK